MTDKSENEGCQQEESPESEDMAPETPEEQQEDYKDKYYYLAAEMENMRRRFAKEREDFIKYGNERILGGLIEVVDNLDRTLDSLKDDSDEKVVNIVAGVEMVRKQFLNVLSVNGLAAVGTEGEVFDPNYHEAVAKQPAEGRESQEIVTIYQKGYTLNGRLLRPAKVVIAMDEANHQTGD